MRKGRGGKGKNRVTRISSLVKLCTNKLRVPTRLREARVLRAVAVPPNSRGD